MATGQWGMGWTILSQGVSGWIDGEQEFPASSGGHSESSSLYALTLSSSNLNGVATMVLVVGGNSRVR